MAEINLNDFIRIKKNKPGEESSEQEDENENK